MNWAAPTSTPPQMPAQNLLLLPADRESVSGEGTSSSRRARPVPEAYGNWSCGRHWRASEGARS